MTLENFSRVGVGKGISSWEEVLPEREVVAVEEGHGQVASEYAQISVSLG